MHGFYPYFGIISLVLLAIYLILSSVVIVPKKFIIYRILSTAFTGGLFLNFAFSVISFVLTIYFFTVGQVQLLCSGGDKFTSKCLDRDDAFYLWFIVQGFGILYFGRNMFSKCCCWGQSSKQRASALEFWKTNFFPIASRNFFESLAKKYAIERWEWNAQSEDDEDDAAEEGRSKSKKGQAPAEMEEKPVTVSLQQVSSDSKLSGHKLITDIVIGDKLGGGCFGEVYKGVWKKSTDVALKTINDDSMKDDIFREIEILEKLAHPNIVGFLGLFISPSGEYFLVTEFMNRGSLDQMIIKNKDSITQLDLLAMAKQAAAGMAYLESQGIVHRDLALRNLLVGTRGDKYERFVVKVADFGLSRSTDRGYYKSESKTIPIKWSALEIILYDSYKYTSKCDAWSFGITLWELFSYGVTPYPGMSNQEAVNFLRKGERLECPNNCPSSIYTLMLQCWKENPDDRPSFEQIFDVINGVLSTMLPTEVEDASADERVVTLWMPPATEYGSATNTLYEVNKDTPKPLGAVYGNARQ